MKICVINPNYYRSSGVTIAIKRIHEGAKNLPIDWHFVDCQYGKDVNPDTGAGFMNLRNPVFTCSLMTKSPIRLIRSILSIRNYLIENRIDVIHVHHRRLAIIMGLVGKMTGIPVLYTGHLVYGESRIKSLGFIDAAIAISASVKTDIETNERVGVIHEISNAAPFIETVNDSGVQDQKSILCIARLDEVKNHKTLIRAWARIHELHPEVDLVLVGEGELRDRLKSLTEELGVVERVHFAGYTNNVSAYIDRSMFLVLPSFLEGQPIVILEGAGRSKAALVTDASGSRDCIPETAILPNRIDPHSPEKMANALQYWLEHPQEVIEEGGRFYDYWKKQASPEAVAAKHFSIYKSLRQKWRNA